MKNKKEESEAVDIPKSVVPILTKGIGTRISAACDVFGEKKKLADMIGVSEAQLYRYINEKSSPTIEPLAQIAKATSVCLEWLATGNGPKFAKEAQAQRFDVETLEQAVKVAETRLKLANSTLPVEAKAKFVADIYQLLIDEGGSEANRADLILKLLSRGL